MMTLPAITAPIYEIKIRSTKKSVEYRSYLVKEEKILMMAAESNDNRQALRAMKDIVRACTFNKIDVDKLTLFDIEYIFLKLRAKSVGETARIKLRCEKCETYTDNSIDLDKIEIEFPQEGDENYQDKNIKLTESVGVILQYISVERMSKFNLDPESENDKLNVLNDLMIASIESVYDADKVYNSNDCSREELVKFVDSMNRNQVEKIERFISTTPKVQKTVKFKCCKLECGHENSITLMGLQSFFV